jgi:predicted small metal-binding protein
MGRLKVGSGASVPTFKCKDIGLSCPFTTSANSEDELLKRISEHAAREHGMRSLPTGTLIKIKKAIKP